MKAIAWSIALLAFAAPVLAQQQPVPLPPTEPVRQASELRVLLEPPLSPASMPLGSNPESVQPGKPVIQDSVPQRDGILADRFALSVSSGSMTLEELESIALANNPAIARASAAMRAARGKWLQAGLPPNPHIGYSGTELGEEGRAGQQGGYIEQEFVRGGKLRLSRAVASQEVRRAEQELAAERFRVTNDVRVGFYDVLVLQRKLELTRQLLTIGEQGLTASDQLFQAQEASRVDVLQARIELNSARILEQNTVNAHAAAWRRLAAILGMPGMEPAPLAGNLEEQLPSITWADALGRLMSASPELAAARASVDRARWAVNRAQAEPTPNINVQATVQHDNASTSDIAGVQATFPLPLLNRNQGGIMQAQAELSAAAGQMRQLELALQHRLASTFERYANARQQVQRYTQEILPDAKTSLDLVTQGYQQGEFGYLTLLTAQRTYFQTNLAYFDSLRELRETTVELEGLLLRDSLQSQITTPRDAAPATTNVNSIITPPPY